MGAALATVLRLEIPPRPDYVSMARLVVGTAAKSRRLLEAEKVDDLTLALSEACTNAIEAHAKAGTPDALVRIDVEEARDRLVVTVTDQGDGFDLMGLAPHPPVDDPERLNYERGLGIPIIRNLVDEVTFTSDESGTVVQMVLHCAPSPEAHDQADVDDVGDLDAAWDDEPDVALTGPTVED